VYWTSHPWLVAKHFARPQYTTRTSFCCSTSATPQTLKVKNILPFAFVLLGLTPSPQTLFPPLKPSTCGTVPEKHNYMQFFVFFSCFYISFANILLLFCFIVGNSKGSPAPLDFLWCVCVFVLVAVCGWSVFLFVFIFMVQCIQHNSNMLKGWRVLVWFSINPSWHKLSLHNMNKKSENWRMSESEFPWPKGIPFQL